MSLKKILSFSVTLLIGVAVAIVAQSYLNVERAFYPWDCSDYSNRVIEAHMALVSGNFSEWLTYVKTSPTDLLFALHHLAFSIFGVSRDVYVTANATIFFLLVGVSCSFYLSRHISSWGIADYIFTLLLSASMPAFWKVTFEGYPDVAPIFVTVLGLLAFSNAANSIKSVLHKKEQHRLLLNMFLFAFCMGCAMGLRRSFAYLSLSILLASSIYWFLCCIRKRFNLKKIISISLMPCLAALLGLTTGILLFGRKTLKLIFQNPVDNEFSAWKGSFPKVIQCWHADFAIPFFILLFFCLFLLLKALITKKSEPKRIHLMVFCIAAVIWVLLWLFKVQFAGAHYSIILLPLAFIITAAVGTHFLPKPAKYILQLIILGIMMLSTASTLFPEARAAMPQALIKYLPSSYFPKQDKHYDDLIAIAGDLRHRFAHNDQGNVLILASSRAFNHTTFEQADNLVTNPKNLLRINWIYDVDSSTRPPVDAFFNARYILLGQPTQYGMSTNNHKGLTFLVQQILDPTSLLGQKYKKIHTYQLNKSGVKVFELYERQIPANLKESIDLRNAFINAVNTPSVHKKGRILLYGNGVTVQGKSMKIDAMQENNTLLLDFSASSPLAGKLKLLENIPASYRHVTLNENAEVSIISEPIELKKGTNTIILPSNTAMGQNTIYGLELLFDQKLDKGTPKIIVYNF